MTGLLCVRRREFAAQEGFAVHLAHNLRGTVSVPGLYAGFIHGFLFGDAFEKGITFKMGQTHEQKYLPELLDRIAAGDLKPEVIISHRLKLADAADGYKMFDKKDDNCRKVVLTP